MRDKGRRGSEKEGGGIGKEETEKGREGREERENRPQIELTA